MTASTTSSHKHTSSRMHGVPVATSATEKGLKTEHDAPAVRTRAGAVGKAAAAADACMVFGVATRDSVSNYATQRSAALPALPQNVTVQDRREHLEEQLNRATNKVLGGSLLVLPGERNRLSGGALQACFFSLRNLLCYILWSFVTAVRFRPRSKI